MARKDLVSRAEYSKQYAERNAEKLRAYRSEYRAKNREKLLLQKREAWHANGEQNRKRLRDRHAENPEKYCAMAREYYEKRAEAAREYAKTYREVNKDQVVASKKRYAQRNNGKINAAVASRKAAKLQRTPIWADKTKISAYYNVCAFFNEVNGYIKYHVDHIVPLQGNLVSGLHVQNNLQVLLAKDNIRKHNLFEV